MEEHGRAIHGRTAQPAYRWILGRKYARRTEVSTTALKVRSVIRSEE
jgi:hypothetical protein